MRVLHVHACACTYMYMYVHVYTQYYYTLVYFDNVLDVVGHGCRLAVNFTHAHVLLAIRWAHVRERNRLLNGNLQWMHVHG